MLEITTHEVSQLPGLKVLVPSSNKSCHALCIDSRKAKPADIFVAFKGENTNGNHYADSALEGGACVLALTEQPAPELLAEAEAKDVMVVLVDEPEQFMLDVAHVWREKNPQWKVIAITGSVGKTTTKEMCAAVCSTKYRVHATKGNYNSLIGLPITICEASAKDEVLVLEMGMNHPNEISRMSACAQPDIACITNIGTAHIGLLGSRENIARTKAEMVHGMLPSSVASKAGVSSRLVLSDTDAFTSFIEKEYAAPHNISVLRTGTNISSDVVLLDTSLKSDGTSVSSVKLPDNSQITLKLTLPGKAPVLDALQALAVASKLQLDMDACVKILEHTKSTSLRLEVKKTETSPYVIDDSYNASPASMAASLDVLESYGAHGKKIAVLGEMGEMGDMAPELHKLVGAYAAGKAIDLLCVIGHNLAKCVLEGAYAVGMSEDKVVYCESVDAALQILLPVFESDDVVLVKASRSEKLDIFASEVLRQC